MDDDEHNALNMDINNIIDNHPIHDIDQSRDSSLNGAESPTKSITFSANSSQASILINNNNGNYINNAHTPTIQQAIPFTMPNIPNIQNIQSAPSIPSVKIKQSVSTEITTIKEEDEVDVKAEHD